MLTVLMVLDAVIAIILIAAILGQEAKSAGMGGLDGGGDTAVSYTHLTLPTKLEV